MTQEKAEAPLWLIHRGVKYVPESEFAKSRAGVLAAVLHLLCNYDPSVVNDDGLAVVEDLTEKIGKLQPAASDLEELLRKEREKGRQQEQKETLYDVLAFNSGLGCTPQEGYRDLADGLRDTKRLSIEQEKARAISGDQK